MQIMSSEKHCFRIVALVGIVVVVLGCSRRLDTSFGVSGSAEVALSLAVDSAGSQITVGTTKAAAEEAVGIDPHEDLAIYVINTKNDTLARWKNYNALPSSKIKFTPGAYKIVAEYRPEGGVRYPSFDRYIYRAEEKFVLEAGDHHECNLVAGLACGKITVQFDEGFSYYYPNYSVDIRTVGTEFLNFKKNDTQRSGYFEPGTVRLRFHLITQDFELLTFSPTPLPAIRAGEHYRLTVAVGADHGNTQVIILRTETETNPVQEVEFEVPRYFLPKDAPTYTTTGFTHGVAQTVFEGEQAEWSLRAEVPGGIASFVLRIGEADNVLRERIGLAAGQNEIDLAGLPAGDPMRQRLQKAGFRWGEALNSPEDAAISTLVWVDFTEAMRARADHSRAEYDFGFVLTDNYDQQLEPGGAPVAVRASIDYPEVQLLQPKETDIWSSTAYFTVQANYDIYNGQHPTLQYRRKTADGSAAWNDAVEGDDLTVSPLSMAGGDYRVQYELTGLNPGAEVTEGREYEFRVLVNEDRISEVYALTTEARQPLPNRDFTASTESALFGVRYVFDGGWATRNPASAGQLSAGNVGATERTCLNTTYPEQTVGSGESWVVMKTSYWGRSDYKSGLIASWTFSDSKQNITAGILYLGSYQHTLSSKSSGSAFSSQNQWEELTAETLGRGIGWPSRPTSLSLDYIFLPKEDDDNRDRGYICVAVYGIPDSGGGEIEIAKGEVYLDPYGGKRETAAPLAVGLDYSRTDVKATKIDVFFSSSERYGMGAGPACKGNVEPDPYTGNVLKIKDVRLNYEK